MVKKINRRASRTAYPVKKIRNKLPEVAEAMNKIIELIGTSGSGEGTLIGDVEALNQEIYDGVYMTTWYTNFNDPFIRNLCKLLDKMDTKFSLFDRKAATDKTADGSSLSTISKNNTSLTNSYDKNELSQNKHLKDRNSVGNHWNILQPSMKKQLNLMADDYYKKTGKNIVLNDSGRTLAEQGIRKSQKNAMAAAATKNAPHVSGMAVDINSNQVSELKRMGLLEKYGFTTPLSSEPWHVELKGARNASSDHKISQKTIKLVNKKYSNL